jgi:hypothetical protein
MISKSDVLKGMVLAIDGHPFKKWKILTLTFSRFPSLRAIIGSGLESPNIFKRNTTTTRNHSL